MHGGEMEDRSHGDIPNIIGLFTASVDIPKTYQGRISQGFYTLPLCGGGFATGFTAKDTDLFGDCKAEAQMLGNWGMFVI